MKQPKKKTKKIVLRGCVVTCPIEWTANLLKHEKNQLYRDWKLNRVD